MENIEEIVAENIARLRKSKNMTQIDLAKQLNYSDKAISKWERGESTPDVSMLLEIAKLFNVDISYLVTAHSDKEIKNVSNKGFNLREFLIFIMLCIIVVLIATIVFIVPTIINVDNAKRFWVAYVAVAPTWSIITSLYFRKKKIWLGRIISTSLFLWTFITTIYCVTLIFNLSKYWLLFIIGVPVECAICLFYFLLRAHKI